MGVNLEDNDKKLLVEAEHNLKVAKQQLEEFGDNENIDEATKRLLHQNYENAQTNLKNVKQMAEVKQHNEKINQEDAQKALQQAKSVVSSLNQESSQPSLENTAPQSASEKDQVVLPNQPAGEKITIHFPDSEELRSAVSYSNASRAKIQMPVSDTKSAEPAAKSAKVATKVPETKPAKAKSATRKVSTREAVREAARQAFIGSSKKKAKKTTHETTKKPAKNAQSASKDSSTMTREQYRKLHSKK